MNIFILHYYDDEKTFNHRLFLREKEFFESTGANVACTLLTHNNFNPVSGRENFTECSDKNFFSQKKEERFAAANNTFKPEIEHEIQKLEKCDFLLIQFPLRFFSMPAVLKGYIDKHFALGRIYGGLAIYENGFFKGKRALLSIIADEAQEHFIADGLHGDIQEIINPIHRGILQYIGFSLLADKIFYAPDSYPPDEQQKMIDDFIARLRMLSAESPATIPRH